VDFFDFLPATRHWRRSKLIELAAIPDTFEFSHPSSDERSARPAFQNLQAVRVHGHACQYVLAPGVSFRCAASRSCRAFLSCVAANRCRTQILALETQPRAFGGCVLLACRPFWSIQQLQSRCHWETAFSKYSGTGCLRQSAPAGRFCRPTHTVLA